MIDMVRKLILKEALSTVIYITEIITLIRKFVTDRTVGYILKLKRWPVSSQFAKMPFRKMTILFSSRSELNEV
jgi:hypothetical protein